MADESVSFSYQVLDLPTIGDVEDCDHRLNAPITFYTGTNPIKFERFIFHKSPQTLFYSEVIGLPTYSVVTDVSDIVLLGETVLDLPTISEDEDTSDITSFSEAVLALPSISDSESVT